MIMVAFSANPLPTGSKPHVRLRGLAFKGVGFLNAPMSSPRPNVVPRRENLEVEKGNRTLRAYLADKVSMSDTATAQENKLRVLLVALPVHNVLHVARLPRLDSGKTDSGNGRD